VSESESDIRPAALKLALSMLAKEILTGESSLLHGAGRLYYIAHELDIDEEKPFDFLWAVRSDCAELPMSESDRFGRHPDWLARQDKKVLETAEWYRPQIIELCQFIVKHYPDNGE
jgi:hypothetical protein